MNYYFIGIKGTGMASLACILHDLGHHVEGSDLTKHFFTEDPLRERNITIYPFDEKNIRSHMNVIIGNAFLDDFAEVKAVKNDPTIRYWRYHEFVGELMKDYCSFGVSGSHGKTTTTGLLSTMLSEVEPTGYLIGDGTGHLNKECVNFVVEADEFRRHFLAYHPDYAIITNADLDHVDYFRDQRDYDSAYEQFSAQVAKGLVVYGDDEETRGLQLSGNVHYYGINDNDSIQAINIVEDTSHMAFDVLYEKKFYGHFDLPLVGRHLLLNSLACIGIACLKGMKAEDAQAGLARFSGVKRRFVVEEMEDGNVFIDDYAHHPTEVKVTIQAARMRYPDRKIVAIFKPHRVGRVYRFVQQFADALKLADEVCLCPFTSIDDKEEGIDIDITYLQDRIEGSQIVDDNEEDALLLSKKAPCVYLFMSSKDIYPLAEKVKKILYPNK